MAVKSWVQKSLTLPTLAGLFFLNLMSDIISIAREKDLPAIGKLLERYLLMNFDVFHFIMFFSVFMLALSIVVKQQQEDIGKYGMFLFLRLGRKRYLRYKLLDNVLVCGFVSLFCVLQSLISHQIAGLRQPFVVYLFLFIFYFAALLAFSELCMWSYLLTKNTALAFIAGLFAAIIVKFTGSALVSAALLTQKNMLFLQLFLFLLLSLVNTAVFAFCSKRADYITTKIKED